MYLGNFAIKDWSHVCRVHLDGAMVPSVHCKSWQHKSQSANVLSALASLPRWRCLWWFAHFLTHSFTVNKSTFRGCSEKTKKLGYFIRCIYCTSLGSIQWNAFKDITGRPTWGLFPLPLEALRLCDPLSGHPGIWPEAPCSWLWLWQFLLGHPSDCVTHTHTQEELLFVEVGWTW